MAFLYTQSSNEMGHFSWLRQIRSSSLYIFVSTYCYLLHILKDMVSNLCIQPRPLLILNTTMETMRKSIDFAHIWDHAMGMFRITGMGLLLQELEQKLVLLAMISVGIII